MPSPVKRAYPRSRRGTKEKMRQLCQVQGLSPLAQGNPCVWAGNRRAVGPIPARAGEPVMPTRRVRRIRAYPRSRRGTTICSTIRVLLMGLSPLAQGNRPYRPNSPSRHGPIPARAGEPKRPCWSAIHTTAYPRSRRGTRRWKGCDDKTKGLSPLAQGNPPELEQALGATGPIPARAGEPCNVKPA